MNSSDFFRKNRFTAWAEVVDLIGLEKALDLVLAHSGKKLYVNRKSQGLELLSGHAILIPRIEALDRVILRGQRDLEIALSQDHVHLKDLAEQYKITPRRILQIRLKELRNLVPCCH